MENTEMNMIDMPDMEIEDETERVKERILTMSI